MEHGVRASSDRCALASQGGANYPLLIGAVDLNTIGVPLRLPLRRCGEHTRPSQVSGSRYCSLGADCRHALVQEVLLQRTKAKRCGSAIFDILGMTVNRFYLMTCAFSPTLPATPPLAISVVLLKSLSPWTYASTHWLFLFPSPAALARDWCYLDSSMHAVGMDIILQTLAFAGVPKVYRLVLPWLVSLLFTNPFPFVCYKFECTSNCYRARSQQQEYYGDQLS